MGGASSKDIAQREMLGAVSVIFRAAKWPLVVDLHANKANPAQVSGPDIMVARPGERRVIKVFGARGALSGTQEKIKRDYEAAGFVYVVVAPEDFEQVVTDAK